MNSKKMEIDIEYQTDLHMFTLCIFKLINVWRGTYKLEDFISLSP